MTIHYFNIFSWRRKIFDKGDPRNLQYLIHHEQWWFNSIYYIFLSFTSIFCRITFVFRSDQLRKEAGILFGMKFEDTLFSTLKKDLEIIRENKDLVSVSPIIQSLKICYYQGCTIINLSHRPSNFTNMLFKSMKKNQLSVW